MNNAFKQYVCWMNNTLQPKTVCKLFNKVMDDLCLAEIRIILVTVIVHCFIL